MIHNLIEDDGGIGPQWTRHRCNNKGESKKESLHEKGSKTKVRVQPRDRNKMVADFKLNQPNSSDIYFLKL